MKLVHRAPLGTHPATEQHFCFVAELCFGPCLRLFCETSRIKSRGAARTAVDRVTFLPQRGRIFPHPVDRVVGALLGKKRATERGGRVDRSAIKKQHRAEMGRQMLDRRLLSQYPDLSRTLSRNPSLTSVATSGNLYLAPVALTLSLGAPVQEEVPDRGRGTGAALL